MNEPIFACIYIHSRMESGAESQAMAPVSAEDTLLRLAFSFSPRIEIVSADTILLDIAGLERLFGSSANLANKITFQARELGLCANIAIAANIDTAIQAAHGIQGITIIPPGNEFTVLRSLPLCLLSKDAALQETWKLWGLRTFGDFASLPEEGVAERLGWQGARLHRIARGAESRALIPFVPAPNFAAFIDLEYSVELLEPLSFILASLLNQICAGLAACGLAVGGIRLVMRVDDPAAKSPPQWERRLTLPIPLRDSIALLKLLRLDLESHPPPGPVIAVRMEAEPAHPRVLQNDLFLPPFPEPGKLELTLKRILKLVGAGNAGMPELVDTHRPGAFAMQPFRIAAAQPKTVRRNSHSCSIPKSSTECQLSFRAFRPPLTAEVQLSNGRPVQVNAQGIRGKVLSAAGPWRSSGDWWTVEPWNRDEWDIEVLPFSWSRRETLRAGNIQSGLSIASAQISSRLYRIYQDLSTGGWWVEGSYD